MRPFALERSLLNRVPVSRGLKQGPELPVEAVALKRGGSPNPTYAPNVRAALGRQRFGTIGVLSPWMEQ
jgi:hypothetical protein